MRAAQRRFRATAAMTAAHSPRAGRSCSRRVEVNLRLILLSAPVVLAGVIATAPRPVTTSQYGSARTATAPRPVTTSQYGSARTGANANESILSPRNVNVSHFGKLGAY